jgi:hypothetical protein
MTGSIFSRRTRSRRAALFASMMAALLLLSSVALAAGGGKPATKLVNVADTRVLTGFGKWVADLYNTSYWLFATAVVLIMATMGLVLGLTSDRLVSTLGINLGRLKHHE